MSSYLQFPIFSQDVCLHEAHLWKIAQSDRHFEEVRHSRYCICRRLRTLLKTLLHVESWYYITIIYVSFLISPVKRRSHPRGNVLMITTKSHLSFIFMRNQRFVLSHYHRFFSVRPGTLNIRLRRWTFQIDAFFKIRWTTHQFVSDLFFNK